MTKLGCFACDTGTARHHQDGAKSWIECECGEQVGQKIDMSDRDHVSFALRCWHEKAIAYTVANQDAAQDTVIPEKDTTPEADGASDDQKGDGNIPEGSEFAAQTLDALAGSGGSVDPVPVGDGVNGLTAVDVHANTNTDLPVGGDQGEPFAYRAVDGFDGVQEISLDGVQEISLDDLPNDDSAVDHKPDEVEATPDNNVPNHDPDPVCVEARPALNHDVAFGEDPLTVEGAPGGLPDEQPSAPEDGQISPEHSDAQPDDSQDKAPPSSKARKPASARKKRV